MAGKLSELYGRFPKVYWVSQTFELLERGAYYSMVPILSIHAYFNVGLPFWLASMMLAFMYPFQYGLPIFTGALAEKVGYKKQIAIAFVVLTLGYFSLSLAYDAPTMILSVALIGLGIGIYKPLVSATIAKCTPSKDRNIAYATYYFIVNLAATLFPIIFVIFQFFGIFTRPQYNLIFLIVGIVVGFNVFTAFFVFEEVPRSGKVKTVSDAVNNVRLAMKDKKFQAMVILTGGFWGLYSTMLFALPMIVFSYRWNPLWFTAMVLAIPNPLTIILLGPILSKFFEKVESMRVILAGIMIYLVGLSIICIFLQVWIGVIFGIIIVSIGEFLVAPGYMAFVSKLAKKELVSAYIGANFISYMIGLLGGTLVFSVVLTIVAERMWRPYFFYGILISFGLFLLLAFIYYYHTWGQDIIRRAQKIQEDEEGIKAVVEDESYREPLLFRLFETKLSIIICLILIPVVLVGTYSAGTFHFYGLDEDEDEVVIIDWVKDYDIPMEIIEETSDQDLTQGNDKEVQIDLTEIENIRYVNMTLTWQDEADINALRTNQPDTFSLSVEFRGETKDGQSSAGSIEISFGFPAPNRDPYLNGTGDYNVTITCIDAGDQELLVNPFGLSDIDDDGNAWNLQVEYKYYEKKQNS